MNRELDPEVAEHGNRRRALARLEILVDATDVETDAWRGE